MIAMNSLIYAQAKNELICSLSQRYKPQEQTKHLLHRILLLSRMAGREVTHLFRKTGANQNVP